ncbi:MAG: DUF2520 domain-containing protein [Prolixibacteraceae bacterium]|nr:DUF2520 domain-containing protein [Prolixibacteraceae bacterium]MBN2773808.1 DUF2520 domain-containing protein [Prolixibacteraceae bacterium]
MSLSCVLIGAGNLATHLGEVLKQKGFNILQVYSRTQNSAKNLAERLNATFTTSPQSIIHSCDFFIIALKDEAVKQVLPSVEFNNKLILHCSGSLPLSVLNGFSENTGVLYPLQTFSKGRNIDFAEIPVFIESDSEKNLSLINSIAARISNKIIVADSEKRKQIHISAVFACNFVNHLYTISESILKENGLDFDILKPLIKETTNKVMKLSPGEAQTGPAVRFDESVINNHLGLLAGKPELAELYKLISESIYKFHQSIL